MVDHNSENIFQTYFNRKEPILNYRKENSVIIIPTTQSRDSNPREDSPPKDGQIRKTS
jgi:hypothetical protein